MTPRHIKQFIYGSLYLVLWAGIIFLLYSSFFKPAATCFDNKKNQSEEETDCGGPCQSCAYKHLQPIRVLPVRVLPSPDVAKSILLLEFQNPNPDFGANPLRYDLRVTDTGGKPLSTFSGESFMYPGELKIKVEANIDVAFGSIGLVTLSITDANWLPRAEFSAPRLATREVVLAFNVSRKQALLTGVLKNDNPFPLASVSIGAIVFDDLATLIGASKTLLENLAPLEERSFQITVPIGATNGKIPADYKLSFEAKR